MSDHDHIQRAAELFERARALDPDQRDAFIDREATGDPVLRDELRNLLKHHESADGVLRETSVSPSLIPGAPTSIPASINGYTIKRRIGLGGMGMVLLAQQQSPSREVAIKVVRPGLVTDEMLTRFELEGAMLGRLQHPNIAQILEAGQYEDESGVWPYLAMEYIDGVPLLDHVRQADPSTGDRLRMFAVVCDAVHHAHQRGVIHRDLKPANILVDRSGQPKILDFGVARAIEPDLNQPTMHTAAGRLVGTLAYMSPEQVRELAGDIDTRSDVYALGVVLYELLTGRLPYSLEDRAITAAATVIAEHPPTPLTTIDRAFRGDLDTIVRKSLEKEPQRRYQSVSDLGADIRRHLSNEPITARPATTIYQLSRFARRNKALITGVGVACLALVAGFAVSTTYAIGQTRALAESERQRDITQAINTFLTDDLVQQADPDRGSEDQLTLLEAIDRATARIEGRFTDSPLIEANLRRTIGTAYRSRHRLDEAQSQLTRALELYTRTLGEHSEDALFCQMLLNKIHNDRGDFRATEAAVRELLTIQREKLGDDHPHTMSSIGALGGALVAQGQYAEAAPVLEELIQRRSRVLGPDHVDTAIAMNNLAVVYTNSGHNDEAAALLERILPIQRNAFGDAHPDTTQTIVNLGMTYSRLGMSDKAIELLEEGVARRTESYGAEHPRTLTTQGSLAVLYGRAERYDEQTAILTRTLPILERDLGPDHLNTLITRMNLVWTTQYRTEAYDDAQASYADLTDRLTKHYPDHFAGGITAMMRGRCLMNIDRFEDAEAVFQQAHKHFLDTLTDDHPHVLEVSRDLVSLYTRWGKPDEARAWSTAPEPSDEPAASLRAPGAEGAQKREHVGEIEHP